MISVREIIPDDAAAYWQLRQQIDRETEFLRFEPDDWLATTQHVRGNTSGPLLRLLREAGAREVHLCVTCPPIAHPSFRGVDMGTHEELIAHRLTQDEIRQHVGADTLHFLSLDGMMRAIDRPNGYCQACFTGVYPIELDVLHTKTGFEKALA